VSHRDQKFSIVLASYLWHTNCLLKNQFKILGVHMKKQLVILGLILLASVNVFAREINPIRSAYVTNNGSQITFKRSHCDTEAVTIPLSASFITFLDKNGNLQIQWRRLQLGDKRIDFYKTSISPIKKTSDDMGRTITVSWENIIKFPRGLILNIEKATCRSRVLYDTPVVLSTTLLFNEYSDTVGAIFRFGAGFADEITIENGNVTFLHVDGDFNPFVWHTFNRVNMPTGGVTLLYPMATEAPVAQYNAPIVMSGEFDDTPPALEVSPTPIPARTYEPADSRYIYTAKDGSVLNVPVVGSSDELSLPITLEALFDNNNKFKVTKLIIDGFTFDSSQFTYETSYMGFNFTTPGEYFTYLKNRHSVQYSILEQLPLTGVPTNVIIDIDSRSGDNISATATIRYNRGVLATAYPNGILQKIEFVKK